MRRRTRGQWRGPEWHSRGSARLEHDDGVCRGLVLSVARGLSHSTLDSSVEEVLSDEDTEVDGRARTCLGVPSQNPVGASVEHGYSAGCL